MSDYDRLKQFIENSGYKIETDIENLIVMCFLHYDGYVEEFGRYTGDTDIEEIEDCIEAIKETGLREFDYYC